MTYTIFGSKDSLDYDVMVYVDSIPPIQKCKELCAEYEELLKAELPDKKINVNLAVVDDGQIVSVFKGTPDECNNSILLTHYFHEQKHPVLVKRRTERDVPLKLARGLRSVLSFLSRTEYRPLVKKALKGTAEEKLSALEQIDLAAIADLGKNNQDVVEFYKQAAFQIGQCLALIDGEELYTKEQIRSEFPRLGPYLQRLPKDGVDLDSHKKYLICMIRERYKGSIQLIKEAR